MNEVLLYRQYCFCTFTKEKMFFSSVNHLIFTVTLKENLKRNTVWWMMYYTWKYSDQLSIVDCLSSKAECFDFTIL